MKTWQLTDMERIRDSLGSLVVTSLFVFGIAAQLDAAGQNVGRHKSSQLTAESQQATARLKQLGAEIQTGEDEGKPYCIATIPDGWQGKPDDLQLLGKLRQLGTVLISKNAKVGDAGIKHLARLKGLTHLSIYDTTATDAGIARLSALPRLEWLILGGLPITDAVLKPIAKLNTLQVLVLEGTRITDAGLPELAPLTNLESLRVANTTVSDVGLRHLAAFKKLRVVGAWETKITAAGVQELEKARPGIKVIWDEASIEKSLGQ